jgi:hypothetical protein
MGSGPNPLKSIYADLRAKGDLMTSKIVSQAAYDQMIV